MALALAGGTFWTKPEQPNGRHLSSAGNPDSVRDLACSRPFCRADGHVVSSCDLSGFRRAVLAPRRVPAWNQSRRDSLGVRRRVVEICGVVLARWARLVATR